MGFWLIGMLRYLGIWGAQTALRIIGPLTRGTFMESGSVPAVSYQIFKIMPNLLAILDAV